MSARPDDIGSASHHDGQEGAVSNNALPTQAAAILSWPGKSQTLLLAKFRPCPVCCCFQGADPASWDGLPSEILVLIMHHLPHQRHQCSLVSTAWRAAAAAATTSIKACVHSSCPQRYVAWVSTQAPYLTSLDLQHLTLGRAHPVNLLDLPAPSVPLAGLRALSLDGFVLSSHTQWLSATSLTRVALHKCRLPDVSLVDLVEDLGALPNLQELSLQHVEPEPVPLGTREGSSAWWQLTQLTLLELGEYRLSRASSGVAAAAAGLLSEIACLSQLRALLLGSYHHWAMRSQHSMLGPLQHLQSLSRLQLPMLSGPSAGTLGVILPKLTSLQHLDACCCYMRDHHWASTLSSLSQLQQLELQVDILTEGTLAALSHLACCGLSALKVQVDDDMRTPSPAAGASRASLASFAALTAGSTLQLLQLRCRWASFACMPAGVWAHVFPDHRVMPGLLSLTLSQEHVRPANAPTLQQLVNCCPGLTALTLDNALQSGPFSPLASLTGLKLLRMAGKGLSQPQPEALFEVCAQLTGLQRLELDDEACLIRANVLMLLTALTRLEKLRVVCTLTMRSLSGHTYRQADVQLSQETPERLLSDVPSQLRQVALDERRALEADEAALPAEWLSLFD